MTLRARLDALGDDELDVVPFGVIALDREGTIVRYNLAEARFARLDRNQVLGKSFFGRVARCAATPAFEGRVRALFDGPSGGSLRLDYVFDFRFGAQEVEVEAIRFGERVYLCVVRKRLLPQRPDGVAREPGAAQQELAPDEARQGVRRDAGQQRIVEVTPALFESLLVSSARGDVPADFMESWGFSWGKLSVVEMEADALERFESVMRDLPMVTAAEFVSDHLRLRGWGRATFDFALASRGALVIAIERSPLAEIASKSRGRRCDLVAGFLRAVVCHLAQRKLVVREVRCVAQGASRCELIAVSDERAALIDHAIASGADTPERAIQLATEARRREA
jgi:photoactive yellow protein